MAEIPFTLRLPKRLNDKVKAEARTERRSKNEQIIKILEERYGFAATTTQTQRRGSEPTAAHG